MKLINGTIAAALASGTPAPAEIALPYAARQPHVTTDALAQVDTLLGSFTTAYATSTGNRITNVTTAAEAINGTILLPGETFSFNKVVGPRTADNGFRTAPVIIDGQLKPGMGGGVCQVSTTLYNAALLADLEIVARSHHSMPVHYVPPGRDATVVYGAIDFQFRNSSAAPIVIEGLADTAKKTLTFRILGHGPAPVVTIERSDVASLGNKTTVKKDPTFPAGKKVVEQKGKAGVSVTVTRVVGEGPAARREVLSHDRYIGEPSVIRQGTGNSAGSATNTSILRQ